MTIDSNTFGDAARFLEYAELASRLAAAPAAPAESGRVSLIVRRSEGGIREALERARLTLNAGLPGDAWGRKEQRSLDTQITAMQSGVAELISNGQSLLLFGDNLFLDFDLSAGNLPTGSLLRVGGATLEVTPKPHNGCHKFRARFGPGSVRFATIPELRDRNLRGIHLRVVEDGDVILGAEVTIVRRAPAGLVSPSRPS